MIFCAKQLCGAVTYTSVAVCHPPNKEPFPRSTNRSPLTVYFQNKCIKKKITECKISTLHVNNLHKSDFTLQARENISTRAFVIITYLSPRPSRLHRISVYLPNMMGLRLRAIPLDRS